MNILIEDKINLFKNSEKIKNEKLKELVKREKEIKEEIKFWNKEHLFVEEEFKKFVEENILFSGFLLFCINYEESLTEEEFKLRDMDSVLSKNREYIYNDTKCCMKFSPLFVTDYAPEVLDKYYLYFKYITKYFYGKNIDKNTNYLFMNENGPGYINTDYSISQSIVVNFSGMYKGCYVLPEYRTIRDLNTTLKSMEGVFLDNKCDVYDYYSEDMRWCFKFNELFITEFIIPLINENWRREFIEKTLTMKIKELNMLSKLKK